MSNLPPSTSTTTLPPSTSTTTPSISTTTLPPSTTTLPPSLYLHTHMPTLPPSTSTTIRPPSLPPPPLPHSLPPSLHLHYHTPTQEQQVQKLKNEKLKIAMMKLKEASVQKVTYHTQLNILCTHSPCTTLQLYTVTLSLPLCLSLFPPSLPPSCLPPPPPPSLPPSLPLSLLPPSLPPSSLHPSLPLSDGIKSAQCWRKHKNGGYPWEHECERRLCAAGREKSPRSRTKLDSGWDTHRSAPR